MRGCFGAWPRIQNADLKLRLHLKSAAWSSTLPLLFCSCHSRHPGILPSSAQGHHRVCRAEDRCLPELKGGGERHPLLPAHWTGAGKTFPTVLSPSPHLHSCGWATCKYHLFAFQLDAKSSQSWQCWCQCWSLLKKLCLFQIKATQWLNYTFSYFHLSGNQAPESLFFSLENAGTSFKVKAPLVILDLICVDICIVGVNQ